MKCRLTPPGNNTIVILKSWIPFAFSFRYHNYIRKVSNVRLRSETTPTSTQTSNRTINWQLQVRVTEKGDSSPNPKFEYYCTILHLQMWSLILNSRRTHSNAVGQAYTYSSPSWLSKVRLSCQPSQLCHAFSREGLIGMQEYWTCSFFQNQFQLETGCTDRLEVSTPKDG